MFHILQTELLKRRRERERERARNTHSEIYARVSPLVLSYFSLDLISLYVLFCCVFSYKLPQSLSFCKGKERRKGKQKEKSLEYS